MKRMSGRYAIAAAVLSLGGAASAGPVNINTADADTLARELNGVGPSVAAEIVRDREAKGRFETPDEIMRVSGIGERILERNRDFILIDSAAPPR